MQISTKRYQNNTFYTSWGTWSAPALKNLCSDHFGRYYTKLCRTQVKLWSKKFYYVWWVVEALYLLLAQSISTSLLVFILLWTDETESFHKKLVPWVAVKKFNWSSHGLSLVERNFKKWICWQRVPPKEDKQQRPSSVDYSVLQNIF